MKNVISQSLGLDLVNINVYAKVYQNLLLSSRDRAIFTFSEFGARQSLDQWYMSCRQYQCVCKILSKYPKRFKSYWHFSRTDRWQNLHKQAGDKIKCLIIGHTMKVNRQFQLSFLGSCSSQSYLMRFRLNPTDGALEDFWNAQQQVHTMLPIAALAFITGIGHVASTTDEGVFASSTTESTGSPSVSGKHNGAGWLYFLELVD